MPTKKSEKLEKSEKRTQRIRSSTVWGWLRDEGTARVRAVLMPRREDPEAPPKSEGFNPYDMNNNTNDKKK